MYPCIDLETLDHIRSTLTIHRTINPNQPIHDGGRYQPHHSVEVGRPLTRPASIRVAPPARRRWLGPLSRRLHAVGS